MTIVLRFRYFRCSSFMDYPATTSHLVIQASTHQTHQDPIPFSTTSLSARASNSSNPLSRFARNRRNFELLIFEADNNISTTDDEMASRPTVTILSADGTASGATHPLPRVFTSPIRPDIVQYVQPPAQQIIYQTQARGHKGDGYKGNC